MFALGAMFARRVSVAFTFRRSRGEREREGLFGYFDGATKRCINTSSKALCPANLKEWEKKRKRKRMRGDEKLCGLLQFNQSRP